MGEWGKKLHQGILNKIIGEIQLSGIPDLVDDQAQHESNCMSLTVVQDTI